MSDELRFVSFTEVSQQARENDRVWTEQMRDGTAHWGHWWFDPETLVLTYRGESGDARYEVDLERCDSGQQLLDWIFHVEGKAWATPEDIGHLVAAFRQILPIWTMIQNPSESHDVQAIISDLLGLAGTR